MLKLKLLFKNLSQLKVVGWQINGFCKAIELIRGGFVTNGATPSSSTWISGGAGCWDYHIGTRAEPLGTEVFGQGGQQICHKLTISTVSSVMAEQAFQQGIRQQNVGYKYKKKT